MQTGGKSSRRVLVVDDDRGIADSLQTILAIAGYDCIATYSASEAIRLVSTFMPHLVISDVVMPGMTGIDLASTLRGSNPSLPVILLSGNAATEELLVQAGEGLGSVLVLAKPYSPRKLLRIVAEITELTQSAD